jgi:hypothetical protein
MPVFTDTSYTTALLSITRKVMGMGLPKALVVDPPLQYAQDAGLEALEFSLLCCDFVLLGSVTLFSFGTCQGIFILSLFHHCILEV